MVSSSAKSNDFSSSTLASDSFAVFVGRMRNWEMDLPISIAFSFLLGCLALVSYRSLDQLLLLFLQLLHLSRERDPPPRSRMMRSNSFWPRYRRKRSSEPTWPGQELSRKRRKKSSLRTRASSDPDTRRMLFQNVTSFGHKARTWLSGHQMTTTSWWRERWDWTPILWHLKGLTLAVVLAHCSTGDDAQAASKVKMAQILKFTHSIRTPFVIAADSNMDPRPVVGRLAGCRALAKKVNIVVSEVGHTCTAGRGRVIGYAVISESVQPYWRRITPEYNSPCKPHIGICLQFTATPTQVRVRQACFPITSPFRKVSSKWCLRESA